MSGESIATIVTAVTGVLSGIAVVVRALIRILASVERVTTIAEQLAEQLQQHVTHHDTADQAIVAKVHEHETAIAVMQAKLPTAAPAGGAVSTPT